MRARGCCLVPEREGQKIAALVGSPASARSDLVGQKIAAYVNRVIGLLQNVGSRKVGCESFEVWGHGHNRRIGGTELSKDALRSGKAQAGLVGRSVENVLRCLGALSHKMRALPQKECSSVVKHAPFRPLCPPFLGVRFRVLSWKGRLTSALSVCVRRLFL